MECARAAVGEVRGLFIGINYYGTSAQLSGCCNDVKQVLGTLQKCGMPITSANILVDEDGFPGRSGQPTRHNILRHLAWLVLGAKPGDVLFLFSPDTARRPRPSTTRPRSSTNVSSPWTTRKTAASWTTTSTRCFCRACPRGAADRGVRLLPLGHDDGPGLQVRLQCLLRSAVRGPHGAHPRGNDVKADVLMVSGEDDQTSADVHDTATLGTGSTGAGGAITQCLTYMIQQDDGVIQRPVPRTRDMLHRKGYTQIPQLCASKPLDLQQQFSLMNKFVTDKSVA
ncbi:Caspase domain [Trypanosoma vivax]|nr:Caspase domain [Trypanosoma vivax]